MNGKKSGSSWERYLAKFLTKWLTGNEKPYAFWRNLGSGSFITNKVSDDASGDIMALTDDAKKVISKVSIEAKIGYDDVDLLKHFKSNKNNTLENFWKQCIRDSRIANKYGMLIYKKKKYPPIIGIELSLNNLLLKQKISLPKFIIVNFGNDLPNMVMYDFETFFQCVSPKNIQKLKSLP